MKAVVFAYQEIGYVCLEELLNAGIDVACLFTHVDDPGEEIWFRRPVQIASERGIPVHTPEDVNSPQWPEMIGRMAPDIIFSFYYRRMIPKTILDIPPLGAFNLHGSLLPRYRGRCPVNWVIIAGERQTGVTLHYMVEKPDAGDIVAQKKVAIDFEDDVASVYAKMVDAARGLMRETVPRIMAGSFERTPQTGQSSYFGGRKPEDGLIDWQKDALSIYNLTRAVTHPYPGAYTYLDGRKLFIWKAMPQDNTKDSPAGSVISSDPFIINAAKGSLKLISVQLEGEPEMNAAAFSASHELKNKLLGGHS